MTSKIIPSPPSLAEAARVLPLGPNLIEYVWGGGWIADLKDIPGPPGTPIGESWEFSVLAAHPSPVLIDEKPPVPLNDLTDRYSTQMLGKAEPILLKFIDARDNLSLQVHPTDAYARAHENGCGKSESWYILNVGTKDGEGYVYLGFNPEARARYASDKEFEAAFYEAAAESGERVLSFVNKIRVSPGEVYHVPQGTVHSIGRGIQLFEIQQSSGLTYRIWDWNRGRELHLKKAAQVLNLQAAPPAPSRPLPGGPFLLDPLGHYAAERLSFGREGNQWHGDLNGIYSVFTTVRGKVRVFFKRKDEAQFVDGGVLRQGHTAFAPALLEAVKLVSLDDKSEVLRCYAPTI